MMSLLTIRISVTMQRISKVINDTDSETEEHIIRWSLLVHNTVVCIVSKETIELCGKVHRPLYMPGSHQASLGIPVPLLLRIDRIDIIRPFVHLLVHTETIEHASTCNEIEIKPVSHVVVMEEVCNIEHQVERATTGQEAIRTEHLRRIFYRL